MPSSRTGVIAMNFAHAIHRFDSTNSARNCPSFVFSRHSLAASDYPANRNLLVYCATLVQFVGLGYIRIGDAANGLLVALGNPVELRDAMRRVLDSPQAAEVLDRNSRARALAQHSSTAVVRDNLVLYRLALEFATRGWSRLRRQLSDCFERRQNDLAPEKRTP